MHFKNAPSLNPITIQSQSRQRMCGFGSKYIITWEQLHTEKTTLLEHCRYMKQHVHTRLDSSEEHLTQSYQLKISWRKNNAKCLVIVLITDAIILLTLFLLLLNNCDSSQIKLTEHKNKRDCLWTYRYQTTYLGYLMPLIILFVCISSVLLPWGVYWKYRKGKRKFRFSYLKCYKSYLSLRLNTRHQSF